METWILLLLFFMSLTSMISNAIGISYINDDSKPSERFLIVNLVISIVFILLFGFLVFKNLRTPAVSGRVLPTNGFNSGNGL